MENISKNIITENGYIYADWTASGKLYKPIEDKINNKIAPMFTNTHTTTNDFGEFSSTVYNDARKIIKKYCGAKNEDILITSGQGMTSVINKLQQIILEDGKKYRIFISHMEHHSNHISWLENKNVIQLHIVYLNDDINKLEEEINKHLKEDEILIGSFIACSNVTGIETKYEELAKIIHNHNGICIVDFACSAPYVKIDMQNIDAICFSGHKFIGGPGTCGILILNKKLYENRINKPPIVCGGGTVTWTNPWNERKYNKNPEVKEDGGTPYILQTIKLAFCFLLKEVTIGVNKIEQRENEIIELVNGQLLQEPNIIIFDKIYPKKLPIYSINIKGFHHNLVCRLLNDYFKIQTRGGCSCAGTYGHYLLGIDTIDKSRNFTNLIDENNTSTKPGWVRITFHFTMSNDEVIFICKSIKNIANEQFFKFAKNKYIQDISSGEFYPKVKEDNTVFLKAKNVFNVLDI